MTYFGVFLDRLAFFPPLFYYYNRCSNLNVNSNHYQVQSTGARLFV